MFIQSAPYAQVSTSNFMGRHHGWRQSHRSTTAVQPFEAHSKSTRKQTLFTSPFARPPTAHTPRARALPRRIRVARTAERLRPHHTPQPRPTDPDPVRSHIIPPAILIIRRLDQRQVARLAHHLPRRLLQQNPHGQQRRLVQTAQRPRPAAVRDAARVEVRGVGVHGLEEVGARQRRAPGRSVPRRGVVDVVFRVPRRGVGAPEEDFVGGHRARRPCAAAGGVGGGLVLRPQEGLVADPAGDGVVEGRLAAFGWRD
nr:hypothetical protein CFP56_70032 [Quercus suber]